MQSLNQGLKAFGFPCSLHPLDLNPFPMKLLRNRRRIHRGELETELCELEQIKAAYVKGRAEQGSRGLEEVVSEEEEEI